jgi:hypothetical protein
MDPNLNVLRIRSPLYVNCSVVWYLRPLQVYGYAGYFIICHFQ